jgi:hypothetical protein
MEVEGSFLTLELGFQSVVKTKEILKLPVIIIMMDCIATINY